jgi:hypothetical protein
MGISCSKNKDSDDKTAPTITLTSPANSSTYMAGDAILIRGSIADDTKVAELHVHVYNNNTAQLLIDIHRYPNASTYTLDESIVAIADTDYKIQVVAVDKTGKQGIETVFVSAD